MKRTRAPRAGFVSGFAYIEVLLALLLLALCALPAANAIQNGLAAANAAPTRAKAWGCLRDKMEAVLAEPYANLLAAKNSTVKTKYSEAKDSVCVERQVYIDVSPLGGSGSMPLLRVDVVSTETTYSFTTLVAP